MKMTLFDLKMFKGGGEIVFPICVRIAFACYDNVNKMISLQKLIFYKNYK